MAQLPSVGLATARLEVRVSPGARRPCVVGRYGNGWKLRVAAVPERGRANLEVIGLLADVLGLPARDVELVAGESGRDKLVQVTGLDHAEAERRLERATGGCSPVSVDRESRRAELLVLREGILTAAREVLEGSLDGGELSSAAGDQHPADHAGELIEREMDDSLEENAVHIVREIDAALAALENGTYGTCARCGSTIPDERLAAVPYATLCVVCKEREQRP